MQQLAVDKQVISDQLWSMISCPLFSALSENELGEVFRKERILTFDANTVVPEASYENPALWVVKRGYVSMKLMDLDGHQMTVCLLQPGDVFGALTPSADERYGEFYRSVTSVCLCRIPLDELNQLIQRFPSVAFTMAKAGMDRVYRLQVRMADLMMRPVESRLAFVLLELDRILGEEAPEGRSLSVRFSHIELAQLIGSSREMVTHVLRKLANHHMVKADRKGLTIFNTHDLEDVRDDKYEWSNG